MPTPMPLNEEQARQLWRPWRNAALLGTALWALVGLLLPVAWSWLGGWGWQDAGFVYAAFVAPLLFVALSAGWCLWAHAQERKESEVWGEADGGSPSSSIFPDQAP